MSGTVSSDRTFASRYAIQQEIGRGGMGVVYLAYDLRLEHRVAVKFLNRELAGAVGGDRFVDEIRTTARLRHPHILPVTDSGAVEGELFYVMPYVDGESLRERLERRARCSVPEALRITREIASALAYAHAHGAVHRDIKPDNVLLDDEGNVFVADFGLAYVLSRVESPRLTAAGVTVGSPTYMSPEQAVGEDRLDGRSDIYSLGCVLFELLVGEPPFHGGGAQATMRRHVVEPPPSVRRRRADVPLAVDRLLDKMLAKDPEQRFPSAQTLVGALDLEIARLVAPDSHVTDADPEKEHTGRRARTLRFAGLLFLLALLGVWTAGSDLVGWGGVSPDPGRWIVLPLEWQGAAEGSADGRADATFYAAFARWPDLELVPRLSVEQAARRHDAPMSERQGLRVAHDLAAGRVVRALATAIGDSIHLDVRLSDAADGGRLLSRISMRVPASAGDPHYALLADSLLFGRITWDGEADVDVGTASAAARRAYGAGRLALEQWDLAGADSLLWAAISHDRDFARANLWLAQLRSWKGEEPIRWAELAAAGASDTSSLTIRESLLAEGLALLSRGDYPQACAAYRRLLVADARDPAAWYGLGECQRLDTHVVPDRSVFSWRFRGSQADAMRAYRRAFALAPGSLVAFRPGGFERLRLLFLTRPNMGISGRNGRGEYFIGRAEWHADTLALVPFPWTPGEPLPAPDPDLHQEALWHQRRILQEVCEVWATAEPTDVDALHALALAEEINGDEHALVTLRRARAQTGSTAERAPLDIRYVWALFKFATDDSTVRRHARALADSLLASAPASNPETAEALSALAVLIGRPSIAARLARLAEPSVQGVTDLPASVTRPAAALVVFSAAGGPPDSLRALERQVRTAMQRAPSEQQRGFAQATLDRARLLQISSTPSSADDAPLRNQLARAWVALAHGDSTAGVIVALIKSARPDGVAAGELTPDVLFSEAALLAATGDTAAAVAWLDPTLNGLEWIQPGILDEPGNAGALIRAIALRAEIASKRGEQGIARRWANVVIDYWSAAETDLQDLVARMRAL